MTAMSVNERVGDPHEVGAHPPGQASNEELTLRYRETQDTELLDELLLRNERLLHFILKRFSPCSEPYEDLFQVARLGMLKAAQKFDPVKGNSFTTYAVAVVDGEVRHYLRDCMLLRQPRWARSLYTRIQAAQNDWYREHGRSPSISELADAVNLRDEGVLEIIRVYGALNLHSLDEPFDEAEMAPPNRNLVRSRRTETFSLPIEDRILLYDALGALSDMHKKIIYLLFFKELTQQEVAEEMGVSQKTISRERGKALSRLRSILSRLVA
jgi:RNA polymerase sigma-B factor